MEQLARGFERLTRGLSRVCFAIALVALAGMALLTIADVFLRYGGRPIAGAYELVSMLAAIAASFSLAEVQREHGHILIDTLVTRFSGTWRRTTTVAALVLEFGVFALVGQQLWISGQRMAQLGQVTDVLLLPLALIYYVTFLGPLVMSLVIVTQIRASWRERQAND